jgi:hypothetical protein
MPSDTVTTTDLPQHFLDETVALFRKQKTLAERAMRQLNEAQLFAVIDPEANSIAVIVKHMRGNMRSRWTDFLTSDGEKPDRHRDDEFIAPDEQSRALVMTWWEEGWAYVFDALTALRSDDVSARVRIRGEVMSVLTAILRQLDHYGQHVGQIVFLAKHLAGRSWTSLSIPRGKSEEFNQKMAGR